MTRATRYVRTWPSSACDDVPDAALDDEPERLELPLARSCRRGRRSIRDPPVLPDRGREVRQPWGRLARHEPAGRVEVEPLRQARGALRSSVAARRATFSLAAATTVPSPSSAAGPGTPGQEHRLGLVLGHPGQPRPIAVDEADPALRSALRVDRDAGLGERLDVAMDRPDRDLQLLGESSRRSSRPGSGAAGAARRAGLRASTPA